VPRGSASDSHLQSELSAHRLYPHPKNYTERQRKGILVWGRVGLQLHPESTLAPLGGTLREPGPLDVGVLLSTNAANHSVVVHSVNNGGVFLGSLSPGDSPEEEGILVSSQLGQQLVLLKTSGVLHRVRHNLVSSARSSHGKAPLGDLGQGRPHKRKGHFGL